VTTKPTIIIYKESLAQSIISDMATFGLILLSIWASQGSTFWTFFTGVMCLCFVVFKAGSITKSDNVLRFYSLDEMRQWIDDQERE
jgi:uncharacterized protein YfaT (DUF1175 family)